MTSGHFPAGGTGARPAVERAVYELVASLVSGLMLGVIYGLAAIGLSLIFGVMKVINLTHGATIALGMFALYFLVSRLGLNPYLALFPVLVGGFLFGVVIYWVAVNRVIGANDLMSLLSTFAVNMILIGVGTALWTTSPYNVDFSVPGITWHGYTFSGAQIIASVLAVVISGGVYVFLYHTRTGKAMRAVASNREAAELMGIPTRRVLATTFGLGIAVAAASGALVATLFPFTILSGGSYELKSFVVTVLGGLGNPIGAMIGGVFLGLVEGGIAPFVNVSWTPVIEFTMFVLVLMVFPRGFFGLKK